MLMGGTIEPDVTHLSPLQQSLTKQQRSIQHSDACAMCISPATQQPDDKISEPKLARRLAA